jgi:hypothetical protein
MKVIASRPAAALTIRPVRGRLGIREVPEVAGAAPAAGGTEPRPAAEVLA